MQPVLEAGHKVPQTLLQLHCQTLQSRDTGCFFRYLRYTTAAQSPLANTSNSRAHTVQLFSAHGEPKLAVICENLYGAEAFDQLLSIAAILRLSFTPHCNKPQPDVYTHTHTHTQTQMSILLDLTNIPSLPLGLLIVLTLKTLN